MMNSPSTQVDRSNQKAINVLIVEDDKSVGQLLCFIVEHAGYQVTYAPEGRTASNLICTETPPSLVVLDVMLPYVDGFELLQKIRTQPGWSNVPVLMLTSKGNQNDISRAYDAGVSDYMTKPFQPEELKSRIRHFVEGCH